MPFWPLNDPVECDEAFRERYHRPPPWFEVVSLADLEELCWELSRRMRIDPPSCSLERVTQAAWKQIVRQDPVSYREYVCSGEPIGKALRSFFLPVDGVVIVWTRGETAARLRCSDLVQFDELLWREDYWAIDEHAGWIVAGMHERPAGGLDLRTNQERYPAAKD